MKKKQAVRGSKFPIHEVIDFLATEVGGEFTTKDIQTYLHKRTKTFWTVPKVRANLLPYLDEFVEGRQAGKYRLRRREVNSRIKLYYVWRPDDSVLMPPKGERTVWDNEGAPDFSKPVQSIAKVEPQPESENEQLITMFSNAMVDKETYRNTLLKINELIIEALG